jgi:hypothetical protein
VGSGLESRDERTGGGYGRLNIKDIIEGTVGTKRPGRDNYKAEKPNSRLTKETSIIQNENEGECNMYKAEGRPIIIEDQQQDLPGNIDKK